MANGETVTSHTDELRELRMLLGPLDPETFVAEYWYRKPAFIEGSPEKLLHLFDRGFIDRCVTNAAAQGNPITAYVTFGKAWSRALLAAKGQEAVVHVPLYGADTIEALLLAGSTLHIGLDPSHDGRLAHFTGALRKQLGVIGVIDVSCWLSSKASGALPHWDAFPTFSVQLEGKKRWEVSSRPIIDRPQSFAYCSLDGTRLYDINDINDADVDRLQGRIEASERLKFIMEPGDVLFIPAGTIHTTETLDDTHSSSISLAFTPANFNKVLELLMQRAFADNPDWRHIPPVVSGKADAPMAGAYVAERIQELKALLDHVVHDDWSRAWAWQKAISQYGNNAPDDPPDDSLTLQPCDHLCVPGGAPLTYARGTDENGRYIAQFFHGEKELTIDNPVREGFAEHLVTHERFQAAETLNWAQTGTYDWNEMRDVLACLINAGFLAYDTRPGGQT